MMAPAGELALTAAQMFGTPAPSPVGIGKDQGASINGLPRDVGAVGSAVGSAGIPSLTGGTQPSSSATPSSMPGGGVSTVADLGHPASWILIAGVVLLGLVHFRVGENVSASVGRKR